MLAFTDLVASMAVNALVTGLIVFRILKVFLESKPTLVERTLGSTTGRKFRHIVFVIIESGMALFVMQLVRLVMSSIPLTEAQRPVYLAAFDFVVVINEMLNVIIIISVHFYVFYFTDSIYLARASHQR